MRVDNCVIMKKLEKMIIATFHKLKKIRSSQKKLSGAWGAKWMAKMNKEEYVLLKCNLIENEDHRSIKDGKVTTIIKLILNQY